MKYVTVFHFMDLLLAIWYVGNASIPIFIIMLTILFNGCNFFYCSESQSTLKGQIEILAPKTPPS